MIDNNFDNSSNKKEFNKIAVRQKTFTKILIFQEIQIRVVHNPAILIPLVEKNGNPATFTVIHAIFENSGKK